MPPVAVGGIVPRGAYGNVEYWHRNPALLPGGCCHVEAPWIQQTCQVGTARGRDVRNIIPE